MESTQRPVGALTRRCPMYLANSDDVSFWSTLPGILTALAGVIAALGTLVLALHKAGLIGSRKAGTGETTDDSTPDSESNDLEPAGTTSTATRSPLRSAPAILSRQKVDAMLVRLDYFEKRRNPAGHGMAHSYVVRAVGDAVVVEDHATGLVWEKSASAQAMTRGATTGYIDGLNTKSFAGYADWRLPTTEEAMSLMETEPNEGFHVANVFGRGCNIMWTADETADGRGWLIYFHDGVLVTEPAEFNSFVRAVR